MKRVYSVYCLAFILLFCAVSGFAQTGSTSLRGTVLDPNGAVIPAAQVTLTSQEIGVSLSTQTDKNGFYQFQDVRPATYVLTVSATGFATFKQNGLVLLVSMPATNDIKMQIASGITTVEVEAASQTINTQDATMGNTFESKQILALPFEGRDAAGVLSLQPGVTFIASASPTDNVDTRNGALNGGRSDQANITLDGVDDNTQATGTAFQGAVRSTLDSIEEFRVTTMGDNADQGSSSGGQITLVTKSGTNTFHGSLYEQNRPTITAANDWFNKQTELSDGLPNVPGKADSQYVWRLAGRADHQGPAFLLRHLRGTTASRESASATKRTVAKYAGRSGFLSVRTDPRCEPKRVATRSIHPGTTVPIVKDSAEIRTPLRRA